MLGFMVPKFPEGKKHFGVLARFEDTKGLFHACEKVRDGGYSKWDAHTPFPVHGLDDAMGLKPSRLPWIVLFLGLAGATGGMLLQYWVAVHGYQVHGEGLVISGKPFFSWPAFVPVTFELGILFGALGAVFGMLGLNQLPTLYHPLFNSEPFERFSDDAFFISIESWDPKFDPAKTSEFLREIGAVDVELVDSGSSGSDSAVG